MKRQEIKTTAVYTVRDANNITGSRCTYNGVSNFESALEALECLAACMNKYGTSRTDYVIVETRRIESIISL